MSTVVDFFSRHDAAFYRCLAANGVTGIARYLTESDDDPRAITDDEIRFAHDAGLEVHFVYEMNPTYPEYFTREQGRKDCWSALRALGRRKVPNGRVVYYAVDTPNVSAAETVPYFNGIEDIWEQNRYRHLPGIYGFQKHVEFARWHFPNIGQHTWQTYGTKTGRLDLWQHEQKVMCGVEVDLNECTVQGWRREAQVPTYIGQSASTLVLRPGEVATVSGIWDWGQGPRAITRKVYGKYGSFFYEIRPPADPDADPTEDLSTQSAKFIVAVSDLG